MNLEEATIKALEGKLIEVKQNSMVEDERYEIDSDYHAEYWAHRCAWDHINEIKTKNIEELKQAYNNLINSIDNEIKTFTDYDKYKNTKYIDLWLNAYKNYIQSELEKLDKVDKYYLELNAAYEDDEYKDGEYGDVRRISKIINIDNGNITLEDKLYNTEEEAKNALNSVTNEDLDKFRKENIDPKYQPLLDWGVDIKKYTYKKY